MTEEELMRAKRREWGKRYREQRRIAQAREVAKDSKGPYQTTVVEADGTEHIYKTSPDKSENF